MTKRKKTLLRFLQQGLIFCLFVCESLSDFVVHADAVLDVRADFAVGDRHVVRVDGVAFERVEALERGVQHEVRVGRLERVDVHVDFQESRNFADKAFEAGFDVRFDGGFLVRAVLILEKKKNNVFYHNGVPLFCGDARPILLTTPL